MQIDEIIIKMIDFSNGNIHDISHFMKVYGFAKTIGECELKDKAQQFILEASAITHDIACPYCRKKYGNTNGKYQETEGKWIAEQFLNDCDLNKEIKDRIIFLISHHHTYTNVDALDYQILLEADYIVNADELNYSRENIENTLKDMFKTKTGKSILKSIYLN